MPMGEYLFIVILCATAVISCCVALMAWIRREVAPATRPFTALMVAIAGYATTAAASDSVHSINAMLFWGTCEYIFSNAVVALYLTFTLYFVGHRHWLVFRRRLLLWMIPLSNIALVMTNHWHQLIWKGFELHPVYSHYNVAQHGRGYYWIAATFYVYVVTGTLLVIRSAMRAPQLHRGQAMTIIFGSLPPLIAGTLYTFALSPDYANILPMSMLFTGLVYFTSLFRFRLFDLLPIARDTLVEGMTEGVLVVNQSYQVIDLNPAAQQFFQLPYGWTGRDIEAVAGEWPEMTALCREGEHLATQVIAREQAPYYTEVKIIHLCDRYHQTTGKLLVWRDVTQQYQVQLNLQAANESLTQQLKEIEILRSQLQEQAIRDSLTGLYNRRYFDETVPAEVEKAKRANVPVSIALLDIDHFKKVNDTYGHIAGDHALSYFATLIQQHIRKSDIACRYGGEEFIIAMPNMPLAEAYERINNIRKAVKASPLTFEDVSFEVTVSSGLGCYPESADELRSLVQKVDQALYAAKTAGRNRVEVVNGKTAAISKLEELTQAIKKSRSQPLNQVS